MLSELSPHLHSITEVEISGFALCDCIYGLYRPRPNQITLANSKMSVQDWEELKTELSEYAKHLSVAVEVLADKCRYLKDVTIFTPEGGLNGPCLKYHRKGTTSDGSRTGRMDTYVFRRGSLKGLGPRLRTAPRTSCQLTTVFY